MALLSKSVLAHLSRSQNKIFSYTKYKFGTSEQNFLSVQSSKGNKRRIQTFSVSAVQLPALLAQILKNY